MAAAGDAGGAERARRQEVEREEEVTSELSSTVIFSPFIFPQTPGSIRSSKNASGLRSQ